VNQTDEGKQDDEARAPAFGSVAVCVDYSDAAKSTIELGRTLAGSEGKLFLVHATETFARYGWLTMLQEPGLEWKSIGKELLERLSREVPQAELVLLQGHPGASIVDWAKEEKPDVVVCAAHRGTAARVALGSVSSYLSHHLPCPVAIARPGADMPQRLTHVAACVDTDARAADVLTLSRRIADTHRATMSAVHVMVDRLFGFRAQDWAPDPGDWSSEWERKFADLIGETRCDAVLLEGDSAGRIVCYWAEQESVDLLVAATHHGAVKRFSPGGFATYVAHHAPCSVLITR